MTIDVIVALSKEETGEKIKAILISNGYNVLAICTYGNELIRAIKQFSPSIVISGYKFKDMNLISIYETIGDECSFLAIVNEPYKSIVQEETDIFCISSPINNTLLVNSLDMIYQSERRIRKLKDKVHNLEEKINERKIIEKAKGIVMRELHMDEEEAFRHIQKKSMDLGMKMVAYSKDILDNYRL